MREKSKIIKIHEADVNLIPGARNSDVSKLDLGAKGVPHSSRC